MNDEVIEKGSVKFQDKTYKYQIMKRLIDENGNYVIPAEEYMQPSQELKTLLEDIHKLHTELNFPDLAEINTLKEKNNIISAKLDFITNLSAPYNLIIGVWSAYLIYELFSVSFIGVFFSSLILLLSLYLAYKNSKREILK